MNYKYNYINTCRSVDVHDWSVSDSGSTFSHVPARFFEHSCLSSSFHDCVQQRGQQLSHVFFSRIKLSTFRESICGSVSPHSCICHALRVECKSEGVVINLPEYASLNFQTSAELALSTHGEKASMIMWNRHQKWKNINPDLFGVIFNPFLPLPVGQIPPPPPEKTFIY